MWLSMLEVTPLTVNELNPVATPLDTPPGVYVLVEVLGFAV